MNPSWQGCRARVIEEYPAAHFNPETRQIEGYTHALVLGVGTIGAIHGVEASAWRDAYKRLRRHG